MTALLVAVFGLALLDTLNPSAVAVTLYLLLSGAPRVSRVLAYAAGMFCSNLLLGAALMVGLGSLWDLLDGPVAYAVQGAVGAALLAYSFLAPDDRARRRTPAPRPRGPGALFLLGAGVTLLEFSTALPYLGAVTVMADAGLGARRWLPILAAYNLVFVAPPLLLLVAFGLFGPRLRGRLERWRDGLAGGSRGAALWIAGIVGFFLLADSVFYYLVYFGLVDLPDRPS